MEVKYDPKKDRYVKVEPKAWPASGVYKVRVTDATIGKVEASVDGVVPPMFTFTDDIFKTQKMENYQIGSELFHSNDQNPGVVGKECVSGAQVSRVSRRPQRSM